jgi:hypothetical protein
MALARTGQAQGGERLIGWEDSQVGSHGLGLQLEGRSALRAIVRKRSASGDVLSERAPPIPDRLLDLDSGGHRAPLLECLKELQRLRTAAIKELENNPEMQIPQAVVVEEGGPGGTRH